VVAVLRAGGEQELLAANRLEEEIFATPAIADGRVYVRTVSALYCFGMR
jgi:outer membrane protein assembly factor BamB